MDVYIYRIVSILLLSSVPGMISLSLIYTKMYIMITLCVPFILFYSICTMLCLVMTVKYVIKVCPILKSGYHFLTWLLSFIVVTLCLHGYPLSTWLPSIYMVTLYLHGYPLSTWLPSIYMVTLYLHGYPLSTWLPSIYMVTLYLHGYPLSI